MKKLAVWGLFLGLGCAMASSPEDLFNEFELNVKNIHQKVTDNVSQEEISLLVQNIDVPHALKKHYTLFGSFCGV